jgi:cyclomaltodextrinase
MLEYFRKMIALRHRYPALRRGKMVTIHAAEKHYAFLRYDRETRLLVVLNSGDEDARLRLGVAPHFSNGTVLADQLGPIGQVTVDDEHVRLNLPARTGCVLTG